MNNTKPLFSMKFTRMLAALLAVLMLATIFIFDMPRTKAALPDADQAIFNHDSTGEVVHVDEVQFDKSWTHDFYDVAYTNSAHSYTTDVMADDQAAELMQKNAHANTSGTSGYFNGTPTSAHVVIGSNSVGFAGYWSAPYMDAIFTTQLELKELEFTFTPTSMLFHTMRRTGFFLKSKLNANGTISGYMVSMGRMDIDMAESPSSPISYTLLYVENMDIASYNSGIDSLVESSGPVSHEYLPSATDTSRFITVANTYNIPRGDYAFPPGSYNVLSQLSDSGIEFSNEAPQMHFRVATDETGFQVYLTYGNQSEQLLFDQETTSLDGGFGFFMQNSRHNCPRITYVKYDINRLAVGNPRVAASATVDFMADNASIANQQTLDGYVNDEYYITPPPKIGKYRYVSASRSTLDPITYDASAANNATTLNYVLTGLTIKYVDEGGTVLYSEERDDLDLDTPVPVTAPPIFNDGTTDYELNDTATKSFTPTVDQPTGELIFQYKLPLVINPVLTKSASVDGTQDNGTAAAPVQVRVGDTIDYTLEFDLHPSITTGTMPAVTIKDALPAGLTYMGGSPTGAVDGITNVVTWNNVVLTEGRATITLQAAVSQPGLFENQATATVAGYSGDIVSETTHHKCLPFYTVTEQYREYGALDNILRTDVAHTDIDENDTFTPTAVDNTISSGTPARDYIYYGYQIDGGTPHVDADNPPVPDPFTVTSDVTITYLYRTAYTITLQYHDIASPYTTLQTDHSLAVMSGESLILPTLPPAELPMAIAHEGYYYDYTGKYKIDNDSAAEQIESTPINDIYDDLTVIILYTKGSASAMRLHIRQIAIDRSGGRPEAPVTGYHLYRFGDGAQTGITSPSGIEGADAPAYTHYIVKPESGSPAVTIETIIPQFYEYAGFIATTTDVAHDPGARQSGAISLDYAAAQDYYVTVYISPNGGDGPYSWDARTNLFGTIEASPGP